MQVNPNDRSLINKLSNGEFAKPGPKNLTNRLQQLKEGLSSLEHDNSKIDKYDVDEGMDLSRILGSELYELTADKSVSVNDRKEVATLIMRAEAKSIQDAETALMMSYKLATNIYPEAKDTKSRQRETIALFCTEYLQSSGSLVVDDGKLYISQSNIEQTFKSILNELSKMFKAGRADSENPVQMNGKEWTMQRAKELLKEVLDGFTKLPEAASEQGPSSAGLGQRTPLRPTTPTHLDRRHRHDPVGPTGRKDPLHAEVGEGDANRSPAYADYYPPGVPRTGDEVSSAPSVVPAVAYAVDPEDGIKMQAKLEELQDALAEKETKLKALREELAGHGEVASASSDELEAANAALQQRLQQIEAAHSRSEEQHQQDIEAMKAGHDEAIAKLREEAQKASADSNQVHEQQLRDQIESLNKEHQERVEELEAGRTQQQQAHEAAVAELRNQVENREAALAAEKEALANQYQAQLAEAVAKHQEEEQRLNDTHHEALQQLRTAQEGADGEHQATVERLREEKQSAEDALTLLQGDAELRNQEVQAALSDVAAQKERLAAREAGLQERQELLEQQQQEWANTIETLKEQQQQLSTNLAGLNDQSKKAKKQLKAKTKELKNLEKLAKAQKSLGPKSKVLKADIQRLESQKAKLQHDIKEFAAKRDDAKTAQEANQALRKALAEKEAISKEYQQRLEQMAKLQEEAETVLQQRYEAQLAQLKSEHDAVVQQLQEDGLANHKEEFAEQQKQFDIDKGKLVAKFHARLRKMKELHEQAEQANQQYYEDRLRIETEKLIPILKAELAREQEDSLKAIAAQKESLAARELSLQEQQEQLERQQYDWQAKLGNLEAREADLNQRVSSLTGQIERLKKQSRKERKNVKAAMKKSKKLGDLAEAQASLGPKARDLQKEIQRLESQKAALNKEQAALKEAVAGAKSIRDANQALQEALADKEKLQHKQQRALQELEERHQQQRASAVELQKEEDRVQKEEEFKALQARHEVEMKAREAAIEALRKDLAEEQVQHTAAEAAMNNSNLEIQARLGAQIAALQESLDDARIDIQTHQRDASLAASQLGVMEDTRAAEVVQLQDRIAELEAEIGDLSAQLQNVSAISVVDSGIDDDELFTSAVADALNNFSDDDSEGTVEVAHEELSMPAPESDPEMQSSPPQQHVDGSSRSDAPEGYGSPRSRSSTQDSAPESPGGETDAQVFQKMMDAANHKFEEAEQQIAPLQQIQELKQKGIDTEKAGKTRPRTRSTELARSPLFEEVKKRRAKSSDSPRSKDRLKRENERQEEIEKLKADADNLGAELRARNRVFRGTQRGRVRNDDDSGIETKDGEAKLRFRQDSQGRWFAESNQDEGPVPPVPKRKSRRTENLELSEEVTVDSAEESSEGEAPPPPPRSLIMPEFEAKMEALIDELFTIDRRGVHVSLRNQLDGFKASNEKTGFASLREKFVELKEAKEKDYSSSVFEAQKRNMIFRLGKIRKGLVALQEKAASIRDKRSDEAKKQKYQREHDYFNDQVKKLDEFGAVIARLKFGTFYRERKKTPRSKSARPTSLDRQMVSRDADKERKRQEEIQGFLSMSREERKEKRRAEGTYADFLNNQRKKNKGRDS